MKKIKKLTRHERDNIRVGAEREKLFFFLSEIEPRFLTLLEMCRTAKKEHDRCWKHFVWHFFWFTYIDPLMQKWVGWHTPEETTPPALQTSEAYDAVYMVLLAACPDCRCRRCNDEDWEKYDVDWHCGHGEDEDEDEEEEDDEDYVRRFPKCTHRSVFENRQGLAIHHIAEEFFANWGKGRVYFIESGDLIKIGWSRNVEKRLASLHGSSALPLKLLGHVLGTRVYERALHEKFRHLHHHLEWFNRDETLLAAVDQICAAEVDKVGVTA